MPVVRTLLSTVARVITSFRCAQSSATVRLQSFERCRRRSLGRNLVRDTLEALIYRRIDELLGNAENRAEIAREFPKKSIHRRNTGYAIDLLAECCTVRVRRSALQLLSPAGRV